MHWLRQRLTQWLLLTLLLALTAPAAGQLRPYRQNPWYWQYRGRPVLLFGGSDRDNLFQLAGQGDRLVKELDELARCGGNYVRCTMSSREYTPGGLRWDCLPYPFAKVGDKYDLRRWNPVYWERLRTFLKETQRRGIFVQLEFWDRWNESGDSRRPRFGWYYSPWNPNNNVNYDWSDSPLLKPGPTGFYNPFHLAAVTRDRVLLPLQQRFVQKILDEVIDGGFDHVLFQVDNESGIGDATLEPDPYWARFARHYALSKGWHIFVCTQRRFHPPCPYRTDRFRDWNNPEVRVPVTNDAFNYCDISQNNGTTGQEHYDNILWFRAKVQQHGGPRPVNNVKAYYFNWPIGAEFRDRTPGTDAEAGARLWRAVFAGAASFRFHRDTPRVPPTAPRHGLGLSPLAKQHLRSLASFLRSVNLFVLTPHNDLLSDRTSNEAYCLAQPGRQYTVFFSGDGDRTVELDVSSTSGRLSLRWLDVARTSWTHSTTLASGTRVRLTAPGDGHWVAVLRLQTDH